MTRPKPQVELAPTEPRATASASNLGLEPPAPVRDFQAFWTTPTSARELVLLGALFALEGVAAHLGDEVRPALQRLELGPSNARFVLVHLQADAEHGAACRAQVLRVAERAPEPLLAGARAAGALWIAMHRCLVDDDARSGA
jgi:hypothetical protein